MPCPPVIRAALTTAAATVAALVLTLALAVLPALAGTPVPETARSTGPSTGPSAGPSTGPSTGPSAGPSAAPTGETDEEGQDEQTDEEQADEEDPLLVQLEEITAAVPARGTVDIAGTVTNVSDEQWTDVNLLAFRSEAPITDSVALAASAGTDPDAYVGARVTEPGTFDTVDELDPGETEFFSMSVPVDLLGINVEAGVYWIGVHASGASSEPRDVFADGRARTFIPYVPRGREPLDAAIVLPLRKGLLHGADGRLASTRWWKRALSDGGRLDRVLDTAEAAGATPYTWLVDPAVPWAVNRLVAGNPERTLDPDPTVPGQEPPPEEPEETPEPTGTATPEDDGATSAPPVPEDERTERERRLAELAGQWLVRMRSLMAGRTVLSLPYGDLDVSAAVRHAPHWVPLATAQSAAVMDNLEIEAIPAVAPESGALSPEAIAALPAETTILMTDGAFAIPPRAAVIRTLGHRVVVTSNGAEAGGPAPADPRDALSLRQRLLSEAALRVESGSTASLVVTLPDDWRPVAPERFFDDLEQRWLRPVSWPEVAGRSAVGVRAEAVAYTDQDVEAELGAAHFATADQLLDAAALLEQVLLPQTTIESQALEAALATLSQQHRSRREVALEAAQEARDELRSLLGEITITAPSAITLSSDQGSLGFTLFNGLDQPVTVRISGVTDEDITLRGDAVRRLAPGSRVPVRWEAVATTPGIHNVRLVVVAEDGTPLGSSVELPVRAARVSALIWYLMAGGTALFFGALAVRLWRRVRHARAAGRPESGTAPSPVRQDGQRV